MKTTRRTSHVKQPLFTSAGLIIALGYLLSLSISSVAADPFTRSPSAGSDSFEAFIGDNPLTASSGSPGAGGQKFLPVAEAYRLSTKLVGGKLQLQWLIADGYYLYRHGFKIQLNQQDVSAQLSLPEGVIREDELFGTVQVYYQQLTLELVPPDSGGYRLTVQSQGCADAGLCYPPQREAFAIDPAGTITRVSTEQEPPPPTTGAQRTVADNAGPGTITLPVAALFAFLGGLILNLMPCVLPVLSLKALGLASSTDSRQERIAHGWWYTAGIVASFGAVAAALISFKWAGATVGWGFQLQSAWFVAALTYLFFVLALLLIGAADFSGSWIGFGQSLASGGGYRGSFFTGALAVLVASPCTAPFMGTAMGFALTQNAAVALLIFCCLGFGMASPFLVISYLPRASRWLPAPGPWMERLRQFLAFPLLATAIWLLWIIGRQAGADAISVVLGGCLLLALALWLNGSSFQVQIVRLGLLTVALVLLGNARLQAIPVMPVEGAQQADSSYSAARVRQLQADGKAVFVNFTADWCITCKANETWVLSRDEIKQAFTRFDVTYLKADWTNRNPQIAAALEEFGRSGIPLYLFYPADDERSTIILPQILTLDLVIETLREHATAPTQTARL